MPDTTGPTNASNAAISRRAAAETKNGPKPIFFQRHQSF
jgi:hypothetical protein